MAQQKKFPIQVQYRDTDNWIPFEVAEEIYKEYSHKFGTDQSLQRIGERGGFGKMEAIKLLYERIKRLEKEISK